MAQILCYWLVQIPSNTQAIKWNEIEWEMDKRKKGNKRTIKIQWIIDYIKYVWNITAEEPSIEDLL